MLLSLCFIFVYLNNDLEEKSFYKITPINIVQEIETTTTLTFTGVSCKIPANSFISATAIACFESSAPCLVILGLNNFHQGMPAAYNSFSAQEEPSQQSLSISFNLFSESEIELKVHAQYSKVSKNSIRLFGFYIQKLE